MEHRELVECRGTGELVTSWNRATGEATCPVCGGRVLLFDCIREGLRALIVTSHAPALKES